MSFHYLLVHFGHVLHAVNTHDAHAGGLAPRIVPRNSGQESILQEEPGKQATLQYVP